MKFLIDNAISPSVAAHLREAGHNALHVRELGKQTASDRELTAIALEQDRVIVSTDSDFAGIVTHARSAKPSLILCRGELNHQPDRQVRLLAAHLMLIHDALEAGCIAIIEPARLRVRDLPIDG